MQYYVVVDMGQQSSRRELQTTISPVEYTKHKNTKYCPSQPRAMGCGLFRGLTPVALEFRNSLPVPVVHAVASMSSDLISRDLAAHVLAASTVMVHISKIWAIFFQRSQRFSTLSMARVAVPPKLPQTASRRMHIDRLHWHQSNRLHELSTTICDSRTAVPIRSSYHTQGMH